MTKEPIKSKQKPTYCKTCPPGKHNVCTHQEHIPPSKKHPEGSVTVRHEHCAKNPPHKNKNILSSDNIRAIASANFSNIHEPKQSSALVSKFPKADKYDVLIQGWTNYWNDIFKLKDPLDPNLVKALMATESGFNENAINQEYRLKKRHAHGLLQVTESTAAILKDQKGELKNHLIDVKLNDLYDPSINICCGIRWLFRKKEIESARLKRDATWEETIIGYKGYWDAINSGKNPTGMQKFQKCYQKLLQNQS